MMRLGKGGLRPNIWRSSKDNKNKSAAKLQAADFVLEVEVLFYFIWMRTNTNFVILRAFEFDPIRDQEVVKHIVTLKEVLVRFQALHGLFQGCRQSFDCRPFFCRPGEYILI